jgi:RNA 2',3'-cyclic 3'-phosphodiesterase
VSRIRAFVALDLPERVVVAVAAWQAEALAGREGLRAIRPEALHLTLAFLGHREQAEIDRAREVVMAHENEAAAVPIELEPEPQGVPRRRPRVVAFGAVSPPANDLRGRIAAELVEAGLLEPERRPWWPHLSVARVRRRASIDGLPPMPGGPGHTFDAVRVALYRSELGPQGARYSTLAGFDLPQTAADKEI